MQNDSPPQTLAELIKLDWLIFEHGKLLKQAKNTLKNLTASGSDTVEQRDRIATIQKHHDEFMATRQDLREYFTKSRLGPSFSMATNTAGQTAPRKSETTSNQPLRQLATSRA
jgi:hypothetical protein